MKRMLFAVIMVLIVLTMGGCGDSSPPSAPAIVTQILSDPVFDGDILQDPLSRLFTVTQGNTQSVFAGINPATGAESRAFLDFPLTGVGGVPLDAVISSATLNIEINSILPQPLIGTIPISIDLVSFQPPTLAGSDFSRTDQPALATTTIIPPISQADFGQPISVDVTPLMVEAQRLGLVNFQVRILEDFGAVSSGLIEINDTTGVNRRVLAPLLEVTYF